MSRKKQHHEEHVDEAWLLPYSDMLTLLLALFIVMFAMGQTDKAKFQAMSKSFNQIFSGGTSMMQSDGNSIIPMDTISDGTGKSDAELEQDKMVAIKAVMEEEITSEGYSDAINVDINEEGLYITVQDVALFDSGKADIHKNVIPLLSKVSAMLNGLENEIKIVGHTDNVPIDNSEFHSNMDLSAERAINVRSLLVNSENGLDPEKTSIEAWGELKPKASNDTEQGRAQNRRVEIVVSREYKEADTSSK